MTEDRIGFLCNIASKLSSKNSTHNVLKSYYLMRCSEITKGYGLPAKSFSSRVRCPHCYLEWTKDTDVKIKAIKLSKTQRKKKRAEMKPDSNNFEQKPDVRVNEMEQICTFCRHCTTTQLVKPAKKFIKEIPIKEHSIVKDPIKTKPEKPVQKPNANKGSAKKSGSKKESTVNLYTNAFDVFSLKNDKNTLSSAIKKPATVIKNNKKKKDKFAGLCQQAVLASAKQKQKEKENPPLTSLNKLNLFLKPSS